MAYLTFTGNRAHNANVALGHRRFIASVFLWLACATFAGSVCDGWRPSESERMASCAMEEHSVSQLAANSCCDSAEQRQHATSSTTVPLIDSPLVAVVFDSIVAPEADRQASQAVSVPAVFGSPPPVHLLYSVFLI